MRTWIGDGRKPYGVAMLLAALVAAGCATKPRLWSQLHQGPDNTSATLIGPRSLDPNTVQTFIVGDPGTSSPVETPDGAILVSVYSGEKGKDSRIVRIAPTEGRPVRTFAALPGQISTPAIDSNGNVHVVLNRFGYPGTEGLVEIASSVIKFDAAGNEVWRVRTHSRAYLNGAPKLVESNGHVSVFVPARAHLNLTAEILAVNAAGVSRTVPSCLVVEGGGIGARATASAPPDPPYSEDPTLTVVANTPRNLPMLVDASDNCGIKLFQLAAATTNPPGWPANLLFPNQPITIDTSDSLGTAAYDAHGSNILLTTGLRLRAYDLAGNEKWQHTMTRFVRHPPAVALNSAAFVRGDRVALIRIDPPQNPNFAPSAAADGVRSIALTPSRIYALGRDGVFVFDTQMQQQSFFAIASGNGGGLAVTSGGDLVVASRNGVTYLFPKN